MLTEVPSAGLSLFFTFLGKEFFKVRRLIRADAHQRPPFSDGDLQVRGVADRCHGPGVDAVPRADPVGQQNPLFVDLGSAVEKRVNGEAAAKNSSAPRVIA